VFGVSGLGLRKRLVFGATFAAIAGAMFLTPVFSQKMLIDPSDGVSLANIRSSGRAVAWGVLTDKIPDEWVWGHGSNASEPVLVPISEHFSHPHNDWLRILFEYGAVGMACFMFGVIHSSGSLWRSLMRSGATEEGDAGVVAWTAALVLSLFGATCALMVTDNVILYAAFFGVPHFMLAGLWHGAMRRRPSRVTARFRAKHRQVRAVIGYDDGPRETAR
jgi:O-antigen ligase